MSMLKKEYQYLKNPKDVDEAVKKQQLKVTPEQKRMLKGFLNRINSVTSVPSKGDKEMLARAYHEGEYNFYSHVITSIVRIFFFLEYNKNPKGELRSLSCMLA